MDYMDKVEINKLSNILQFFQDIPKDISNLNSVREWSKNAPKELFEFKSLGDKFIKILESSEKKADLEGKKKIKEIKEFLINLNEKISPHFFKFLEGEFYSNQKEYDKAIECWMQIPHDYQDISDVYLQLGLAYLEQDNEKEALQWFNKSYQLKQDSLTKKCIDFTQWELAVKKDYAYFRQWQVNTSRHYDTLKAKKVKADSLFLNKKYPTRYIQLEKAIELNKRLKLINFTNLEDGLTIIKESMNDFPDDPDIPNQLKDFLDLTKVGAYRLIPNKITQNVKKIILELGIKFNRLQMNEIAEKCHEPEDVIIVIIKQMLSNNEINGEYFQSSKSIVFDQKSNKRDYHDQLPTQKVVNTETLTEGILQNIKRNIEQLLLKSDLPQMVNEVKTLIQYQENKAKIVCK